MIDENEFFRNVTLRICGNLEIEEGLRSSVEYLSRHIPTDAVYLERIERHLGATRIIARADAENGKRMDVLIPLSAEGKADLEQSFALWRVGKLPTVLVINDSREDPISDSLLTGLGEPVSSVMSLPLIVGGQLVGALVLLAEGIDRFDEHHERLYATLREPFFVAMSNTLKHEQVVRLKNRLVDDNQYLHRELLRISGDEIIGADFGLRGVMEQVNQVASTDTPVMLTGETGVGKDVIANAIHLGSPRCNGPFIPVNCGAIPESLIDSELFGHEKGAFTGALSAKRGRFERADGGTILLDEIGEMPPEAQVRLLRVIQQREIERVGGIDRIPVDIRIIAATNKNLAEMMQAGRFREDLWFRLHVFPIDVPPLRERAGDIPALVRHFMVKKATELKIGKTPKLAPGAIDILLAYHWPGNVRELENVIERAMILHRGEPLRFDDMAASLSAKNGAALRATEEQHIELDSVIAEHIRQVLSSTNGKIHGPGGAGELLGVNPSTLRAKMRKLGIPFRSRESST